MPSHFVRESALAWRVIVINLLRPILTQCLTILCFTASLGAFAVAQELPVRDTERVRNDIEAEQQKKRASEKELALKRAAADVAQKRVAELQKQLAEATARAKTEQTAVEKQTAAVASLDQGIAALTAELQTNQAADSLQQAADVKQSQLDVIEETRRGLEGQLAGLRKNSIEWRSRMTEAEQRVQAAQAKKPEAEKKVTEAQAAYNAAAQAEAAGKAAVDTAAKTVETMKATMAADQQKLDAARAALTKLDQSLASLRASSEALVQAAAVTGADVAATNQGLQTAIGEFAPLRKSADELAAQLTASIETQAKAIPAAVAEMEKKQNELKPLTEAATKTRGALDTEKAALAALQTEEADGQKSIADAQAKQQAVDAQIMAMEPSLQKLSAEIQMVTGEVIAARSAAQEALAPLGRFVSFSREVAPILADRCVACHNTRSPGGRLNLDSFSALMKGGESGAAVTAHGTDSLLLLMVEDGSMPKDADPLKPEEVAVLKRWVAVGAPLDAGTAVGADLFDVMPELPQPSPPESYRVPIPVTATAFSPDGALLASSGYHEILIWKTDDGSLVRRITNVEERVYDLEFSRDGSRLLAAAGTPGQLGEAKLFTVADGQLLKTLVRSRDAVFAVSFSPDDSQIAAAGADRTISVANVNSGEVTTKIEDHADWVMDINWSPDGQKLVSSSRDKTCKVFVAATGQPQTTFNGHTEPVYSAAFLADSKT
ncbi:MAG: hypothetical protein KDA85_16940, partial [Planctomycetaceae bacterium]|nr:hypothetical protein [Planctomycetaceae bacterium]